MGRDCHRRVGMSTASRDLEGCAHGCSRPRVALLRPERCRHAPPALPKLKKKQEFLPNGTEHTGPAQGQMQQQVAQAQQAANAEAWRTQVWINDQVQQQLDLTELQCNSGHPAVMTTGNPQSVPEVGSAQGAVTRHRIPLLGGLRLMEEQNPTLFGLG